MLLENDTEPSSSSKIKKEKNQERRMGKVVVCVYSKSCDNRKKLRGNSSNYIAQFSITKEWLTCENSLTP